MSSPAGVYKVLNSARVDDLAARNRRLIGSGRHGEAYAAFLVAFNNAAHIAGNLAPRPGRDVPSGPDARELADYFFDENVTPALRSLEIVATDEAAELAQPMMIARQQRC